MQTYKSQCSYSFLITIGCISKTEFENQINTLKSEQMAEKNFAFVGKTAIEKLAGLNPVISQNAEIASNIQNLFIKSITDKSRIDRERK